MSNQKRTVSEDLLDEVALEVEGSGLQGSVEGESFEERIENLEDFVRPVDHFRPDTHSFHDIRRPFEDMENGGLRAVGIKSAGGKNS